MRRPRPLLLVLGLLLLSACNAAVEGSDDPAPTAPDSDAATETVAVETEEVGLTVYLREGEGSSARLAPVTRDVEVTEDLPRRAVELLIAGPREGEAGLYPPLPTSTRLVDLEVTGGTAHVVLSPEAIRDASTVGDSPTHEVLALAALGNTLTEFPTIDEVRLVVEGQGIEPGDFWGSWGIPEVLVRDESLVAPREGTVPELAHYTTDVQQLGSDEASDVLVTRVRARDRLAHVRMVVQLGEPGDGDADVSVPRVRVRGTDEGIVLEVHGVREISPDVVQARLLDLSDPAFRGLDVELTGSSARIVLRVDDARKRQFWLHSFSGPTRIVLDVKK